MKLKKIASLMLAGVMAVSMLSACGEGSGNGNGNEDENKPVETVSNAVTYANDMLDSDMKEYVNFISSTALDGWAAKYTTDTGKFSADDISKVYAATSSNGWAGQQTKMENQLKSDLKAANVLVVDDDTDFRNMPADKVSQSKGTVMVLSGMLDEKSAVETAVATLGEWAKGDYSSDKKVLCKETVVEGTTVYNCDYTVEINAVKVTNDSLTTESAWVISMVINQKVTKAANVQV